MVKVKEIMKKRVITVRPEQTIYDAARIMTNNRVGSAVVIRGEHAVDIVTESDVTTSVAKGLDPKKVKISDMSVKSFKRRPKLVTAGPEDNVLDVARLMVKNGVKRVPVVKDGKLMGIIADKEILIISPELVEIMSERMKARVSLVAEPRRTISGICENCGNYSDELRHVGDQWVCQDCRS